VLNAEEYLRKIKGVFDLMEKDSLFSEFMAIPKLFETPLSAIGKVTK
jgi:hypothetical protein